MRDWDSAGYIASTRAQVSTGTPGAGGESPVWHWRRTILDLGSSIEVGGGQNVVHSAAESMVQSLDLYRFS
jgi:hypothetical protein